MAEITRELNDELRDMGVSQSVLLGHSVAGVLLPMMAVQAPALFSRLVCLRTAVPLEGQLCFAQRLGCDEIIEINKPHEPFVSH